MKLPRDISGDKLARLLRRFGYEATRQTGSHIRLTSTSRGEKHHITIPAHRELRVGTLNAILTEVAAYQRMSKEKLVRDLFD